MTNNLGKGEHKNHGNSVWLHNLLLINLIATIIAITVAVTLVSVAFGDVLIDLTPDKGEVMPWAGEVDVKDLVENGIHVQSGLVYAPGFQAVRANCTICHSAKLVTQNRASRQGWSDIIKWMQQTQGLADLGLQHDEILDYLAAHYAPDAVSRRTPLDQRTIDWYTLNIE